MNWEGAKICFAELQRKAPTILQQGVIIGGIGCWFYRNLLQKANDPDFRVPKFSAPQEELWLSKDIDFTNFFAQDARDILKQNVVTDAKGRSQLQVSGIPIGFAQVGLTFDPESAWAESWIGNFRYESEIIQFRILEPVSLYREKMALSQRRGFDSDRLHLALMAEFLRFELCKQSDLLVTAKTLEEKTPPVKFLLSIRDRAPEIARDKRVQKRVEVLGERSAQLAPSERKLISEISALAEISG